MNQRSHVSGEAIISKSERESDCRCLVEVEGGAGERCFYFKWALLVALGRFMWVGDRQWLAREEAQEARRLGSEQGDGG